MRIIIATAFALIFTLIISTTITFAQPQTVPDSQTAESQTAAKTAAKTEVKAEDSLEIHFGSGKFTIAGDQAAVLDQAARLFREGSPLVMIVAGSADTVGPAERNLNLSIRRAQAVAIALADRGIPIERLQVLGRGNSELAVDTGDGVANAENRTVSITWR